MPQLSRHRFLVGVVASTATLVITRPVGAIAPPAPHPVYRFDPLWGLGTNGCPEDADIATAPGNCKGCGACARHAENKIFATRELAEAGRAHPHCKCLVQETAIPYGLWFRLFGRGEVESIDLRSDSFKPLASRVKRLFQVLAQV